MRVDPNNDLRPVLIDIHGDKRQVFENIADIVLRKILEEDEMESSHETPTALVARTSTNTASTPLPLSINQLLSTPFFSQPSVTLPPTIPNPLQLALYSALLSSQNNITFPMFGVPSPFPVFVPPPQPQEEEANDFLKILAEMLSKQRK